MADPYSTLGVAKGATDDEIKKAYRKLAMKWHPDRNPDNLVEAEKNFKDVKEAFEKIETAEKRAQYDAEQFNPFASRSKHYTYDDSDIFKDFFADFDSSYTSKRSSQSDFEELLRKARGRNSGAWERVVKNEDANIELEITLEDAFNGKELAVTYTTPDGETRQVLLNVPKGIDTGKRIRVQTAGCRKLTHLPSGDLYVTIKLKRHAVYEREGQNLVMRVEVPVIHMLAGGQARVMTIDDKEYDINIRPCTQPGTRIRIPEQGMTVLGSRLRGDFYVELIMKWPEGLTDDVIAALRTARDLSVKDKDPS
jgi:curved DNA-binding protein